MATYYFKVGTGEPFTDKTDAGDDAVAKGHAVKATNAPDNTESNNLKSSIDCFTSLGFAILKSLTLTDAIV